MTMDTGAKGGIFSKVNALKRGTIIAIVLAMALFLGLNFFVSHSSASPVAQGVLVTKAYGFPFSAYYSYSSVIREEGGDAAKILGGIDPKLVP